MTKKDGKPCTRCGTSEWYDSGRCKKCTQASNRRWEDANPEKRREQGRRWRKANPDKSRANTRKWHKENPDKIREIYRSWCEKNPEKRLAINRQWQKNNPENARARSHRYRTSKSEAGGSFTASEWKALKKQYGGRCACCGQKTKLTADHVVPVIAGGSSDISNIQPLCKSCNSSKRDKATDYRTKPGILRWIQDKLL